MTSKEGWEGRMDAECRRLVERRVYSAAEYARAREGVLGALLEFLRPSVVCECPMVWCKTELEALGRKVMGVAEAHLRLYGCMLTPVMEEALYRRRPARRWWARVAEGCWRCLC